MTDAFEVVYDVTDDWRFSQRSVRPLRRLLAAEETLAYQARTVVCSEELRVRWKSRYGVDAPVVHNAADIRSIHKAARRALDPERIHIGYVGTIHEDRLDFELVSALASEIPDATVHLVGPTHLDAAVRTRLCAHPQVRLHGAVPSDGVPSWLVSFDVLIAPHRVTPFTMSLDAIKAYEYLATGLPVVATKSSGFQDQQAPGLRVTKRDDFVDATKDALAERGTVFSRSVVSWDERVTEFARALFED